MCNNGNAASLSRKVALVRPRFVPDMQVQVSVPRNIAITSAFAFEASDSSRRPAVASDSCTLRLWLLRAVICD